MLTADFLHRHTRFRLLQYRHNLRVAELRSFHGLPPSSILPRFSTYDWSTFRGSLRSNFAIDDSINSGIIIEWLR